MVPGRALPRLARGRIGGANPLSGAKMPQTFTGKTVILVVDAKPEPKPEPVESIVGLKEAAAGLHDLAGAVRGHPEDMARSVHAVEVSFVIGMILGFVVGYFCRRKSA